MPSSANPERAADRLEARVLGDLGGRQRHSWLIQRHDQKLVLRSHSDPWRLGPRALRRSIEWEAAARHNAISAGWPAAGPVGDPFELDGVWWTVETWLPGESSRLSPGELGKLISRWHRSQVPVDGLGGCPGTVESAAVLAEPGLDRLWSRCADAEDRTWLERRYEQARALADGLDWAASPTVVVHGDLTEWNLLWGGVELTGMLDFELATVDRRVVEFVHSWRCRYDEVVLAYHARSPLTAPEWPMLLADWWARLLHLCAFALRQGRQPDRWELDGLRRTSPLAEELHRRHLPARLRTDPGVADK